MKEKALDPYNWSDQKLRKHIRTTSDVHFKKFLEFVLGDRHPENIYIPNPAGISEQRKFLRQLHLQAKDLTWDEFLRIHLGPLSFTQIKKYLMWAKKDFPHIYVVQKEKGFEFVIAISPELQRLMYEFLERKRFSNFESSLTQAQRQYLIESINIIDKEKKFLFIILLRDQLILDGWQRFFDSIEKEFVCNTKKEKTGTRYEILSCFMKSDEEKYFESEIHKLRFRKKNGGYKNTASRFAMILKKKFDWIGWHSAMPSQHEISLIVAKGTLTVKVFDSPKQVPEEKVAEIAKFLEKELKAKAVFVKRPDNHFAGAKVNWFITIPCKVEK